MPDGTKLSGNTFEAQATQVLRNLEAILHEAGSGLATATDLARAPWPLPRDLVTRAATSGLLVLGI